MRPEIAISAQGKLNARGDSNFCAKSVRCNIFTNSAAYHLRLLCIGILNVSNHWSM